MASISRQRNGRRTVQFVGLSGKRHSIRLGKVPQRTAETIKIRIEHLVAAAIGRHGIDPFVSALAVPDRDLLASLLAYVFLFLTLALGFLFVGLQAYEYIHAYHDLNLTLESGIYGSTFFMLTGFHGLHVTIGAIMLTVILLRAMAGHFKPRSHFGFEAVAWYWHFVDVVWLGLFIFVYVL